MPEGFTIRPLGPPDAPAYKRLRDMMLAQHPSAFTSDATAESARTAASYLPRLGVGPEAPCFTFGALGVDGLVAAISCERESRVKVRHIGHLVGMMVHPVFERLGLARALLSACLDRLRATPGIELVTLSVTADNPRAIALYERAGFTRYGSLPRAIRVGDSYHDKDLMHLDLR